MKYNGTTVPTGRDNTYDSNEIHRKSSIEMLDSAFNEDQKGVIESILTTLNSVSSSVAALNTSVLQLDESVTAINASLLSLDERVTALEPADDSGDDSGEDSGDNEVV